MNTLYINCSPKKRLSASAFLISCASRLVGGERRVLPLRTPSDHAPLLAAASQADALVFAMPLYVDAVPSHVLSALMEMEQDSHLAGSRKRVYVLANNGFIEGRQNEPLMRVMENFCERAGLAWCGGLGIGGGVMMNVMRIMLMVYTVILLLNIALSGLSCGNWLPAEALKNYGVQLSEVLVLMCGIIVFLLRFAHCVRRGRPYGTHYTRIMLPSFVFILCADIFFLIISALQGGLFRGWLARKQPAR